MTTKDYELVADQPSYYSAKVRACMQYKRIPYVEIGCNIETLSQRVIPATGDHTFPVVFCPDDVALKDGCDIVEALDQRHPERPITPEDPLLNLVANLIETMADEYFAIAMIYYRWIPEETQKWALNMFSVLNGYGVKDPEMAKMAKDISAHIATEVQSRLPKVGLDREDVQQECIKITEKVCDLLEIHLQKTPFILGDKPSLADLALMNAMWGHLYLDPCEASMYIRKNCTHLSRWITMMHSGAGISDQGELYMTDTLKDLLRYFGNAFSHMAFATVKAADEHLPDMEIEQPVKSGLGKIDTGILDVELTRPATTYGAWRLQRLMDKYQDIPASQKAESDALLEDTGFLAVCQHQPTWRMEKQNCKLHLTKK